MKRKLLVLFIQLSTFACVAQVTIKGQISNYGNKPVIITTTGGDTLRISTQPDGYFYCALMPSLSVMECTASFGEKKVSFFSSIIDTTRIAGDYKDFEQTVTINKKRPLVNASDKIRIISATGIDSLPSVLALLANKVTLIDVWATWCGPCISQQKVIDQYKDKYREKGVDFFYLSMDKAPQQEHWKKFIYTNIMEGSHFRADEKLFADLVNIRKFSAIPIYLIVDKNKVIHYIPNTKSVKGETLAEADRKHAAAIFREIDKYLEN